MNENDINILQLLMEDARKSNVEIALAIGVREETVRRRRAGLEKDGVYEVVAIPDYRRLGHMLSFCRELRQMPHRWKKLPRHSLSWMQSIGCHIRLEASAYSPG